MLKLRAVAITGRCRKTLVKQQLLRKDRTNVDQLFQKHFCLQVVLFNLREQIFQSAEFLYFTEVDAANYSVDMVFFRRARATIICIYTERYFYIMGVLLFQKSTCSHTFEWYRHYFRRPLAVIQYFQGYCVSFKQALAVIPFFKNIELIHKSSCGHPFNESPFSYYKRTIAATHSSKFTVFFQNRNYNKEIS